MGPHSYLNPETNDAETHAHSRANVVIPPAIIEGSVALLAFYREREEVLIRALALIKQKL